jgi:hypothetical protein
LILTNLLVSKLYLFNQVQLKKNYNNLKDKEDHLLINYLQQTKHLFLDSIPVIQIGRLLHGKKQVKLYKTQEFLMERLNLETLNRDI